MLFHNKRKQNIKFKKNFEVIAKTIVFRVSNCKHAEHEMLSFLTLHLSNNLTLRIQNVLQGTFNILSN